MTTKLNIVSLFTSLYFVATVNLANGQGTLLFQHAGYNDPVNEGFYFTGVQAGAQVGAVTNDLGKNAWFMEPSSQWVQYYARAFTTQEQALVGNNSSMASATLRLVGLSYANLIYTPPSNNGFSSESFQIAIHNNATTNLEVQIGLSAYYLINSASTYNNFQLVYDPQMDSANLWVNGILAIGGITGQTGTLSSGGLFWDVTSGQANWSLVSVAVVPEPSSMTIILLGSGVLAYVVKRKHR
jgi:hypothetical protein